MLLRLDGKEDEDGVFDGKEAFLGEGIVPLLVLPFGMACPDLVSFDERCTGSECCCC